MPSKSAKQAKFMRAIAHGWKPTRMKSAPSQAVAQEFVDADKREGKYSVGGMVRRGVYGALDEYLRRMGAENFGREPRYAIPALPGPEMVPEPGSIAADIYDRYGITDPTATRYDMTSRDRLRQDPYAHLDPSDPARREYERWDFRQGHRTAQPVFQGATEMRASSPHRERLAAHQRRMEDILGVAKGGKVQRYQMGGLARASGASAFSGMPESNAPPSLQGHLQRLRMARRLPPSHQNRIGMHDQQGGLSRAMQAQTGRPPISRRAAFPGSRTNQF